LSPATEEARVSRKQTILSLAAALAVAAVFALGYVVGANREASPYVHVDRDISGTVVRVSDGNEAVAIDTGSENESFQLLTDVPLQVGQDVEGTVVELDTGDGVTVEAVILR
jgi:hypothetical protein